MSALPDAAKGWVDGLAFAVLATVNADGSPQSTVHWIARDGDDLLLSTVRGRRHARNVERDPRVSVLVPNPDDPYAYVEVRATAIVTEEGSRELIDDLSEKYRGIRPYKWDKPENVRLVIRVPPERVASFGA
jgi:PPOX class probable F420-dependent enzyme